MPDEELCRACRFLQLPVRPATVVRASYSCAASVALLLLPLVALVPSAVRPLVLVVAVACGLATLVAVRRAPTALASLRRSRALGAAPELVGRAVLRMRVEPAPEAAVAFAARHGDGPLAASLSRHVRGARGRGGSGIDAFAAEWGEWVPALARSAHLLAAAGSAPPARRERTLQRALDSVLDGAHERLQAFVSRMGAPVTAIYAFGVLLPLALVGVLPGARAAGVPVSVGAIVLVYDVVLPLALLAGTTWLVVQRPVAFPAPEVDASLPGVDDRRWSAAAAGMAAAAGGVIVTALSVARWAVPLTAIGLGVGVALAVRYQPFVRERERVRAVERALPDALALLGRRIADGTAVERALERTATELSGPAGDVLADAARRSRTLGVGPEAALLGPQGALQHVPSRRLASTAALVALAAREGSPAGQALVAMGGHLEDLQSVEREGRHELARLTGTLRNTAALFGPLVAGATVAMADGVDALGGDAGVVEAIPTAALGLAVGGYVLALAGILAAMATVVEYGFDASLLGYRVGLAVASATAVFLAAFVGAGLLL